MTTDIQTNLPTDNAPVRAVEPRHEPATFDLPEDTHGIAQRLMEAQKQLDDNPMRGMPPKLTEHPITHLITWMFEQTGYPAPDKWVSGSKMTVIGGPVEYRNIANNEFRRILGIADISGKVSSFDMRFLLNRDPGTAEWLRTLQAYVIPFILENSLLELTAEDFLAKERETQDA